MIRLFKDFARSIIINAMILWVLDYYQFGISIQLVSSETMQILISFLGLGFIFWIFNFLIKKILKIVSFPLRILTLGLISILINVGILYAFAQFVNQNFSEFSIQLGGFYQTLILSIVISLAYYLLSKILK